MFYDNFLGFCTIKGVKPAQVARELGLGQSTISMWKSQGTTPHALTVNRLAKYFDTTPEKLLQAAGSPDWDVIVHAAIETSQNPSPDILLQDLGDGKNIIWEIKGLSKLNSAGIAKVREYIDDLSENEKYLKDGGGKHAEKEQQET
jgi:transcriptional regulator with XRE-family HTH domain